MTPLPTATTNYLLDNSTLATKTIDLRNGSPETVRQELLDYFHKTFTLYESIFECLKNDNAFYTRANTLRHPLIFYYGHTAVFFINKLNVSGLINERIDPKMESSLAIGVDEMSWDDLDEQHYDWPTPTQVKAYRDKARAIVDQFIRQVDFLMPIQWESPLWIIVMGIEHERIHLETTSVLLREMPLNKLQPHPLWSNICQDSGSAPENKLLPVEGGHITLGKSKDDPFYGWDNEYGHFEIDIKAFKASKYLVSNQEFLEFVNDDGYQQQQYWSEEGWAWVQYRQAEHPVYWLKVGSSFKYRVMLDEIDMPWDWPVNINFLEAKAFCNWLSEKMDTHIRMPTAAEWYQLRAQLETDQPFWDKVPGNINLQGELSSCPVTRHQFAGGFYDIIGNAWQWTETTFDGFDGFEAHPLYDDFSTPTFDGKHNLFKGGSWISTGNCALKNSRYAFRRHFFQYSGLRYVAADQLAETTVNIYEKDEILSQYIELHYGDEYFGVPNFPVACIKKIATYLLDTTTQRALDIGCAVGRASFELAKIFDHVDAVDFSVRLIEAPTNLQNHGIQRYVILDEGELVSFKEVNLNNFDGYDAIKNNIEFIQGDACNLANKFDHYDLVFAANLIDRLYDPAQFLTLIKGRINSGGLLVIASPYTWLTDFTPRDKWLGGFKADTGENYSTLDGIAEILGSEFVMVDKPTDIPFVIRETARKFQHTWSQMSVWKKCQ